MRPHPRFAVTPGRASIGPFHAARFNACGLAFIRYCRTVYRAMPDTGPGPLRLYSRGLSQRQPPCRRDPACRHQRSGHCLRGHHDRQRHRLSRHRVARSLRPYSHPHCRPAGHQHRRPYCGELGHLRIPDGSNNHTAHPAGHLLWPVPQRRERLGRRRGFHRYLLML
jgi:hypothetical protein